MNYFNKLKEVIKEKLFKSPLTMESTSVSREVHDLKKSETKNNILVVEEVKSENLEIEIITDTQISDSLDQGKAPIEEMVNIKEEIITPDVVDMEQNKLQVRSKVICIEKTVSEEVSNIEEESENHILVDNKIESVHFTKDSEGDIKELGSEQLRSSMIEYSEENFVAYHYKNGKKHILTMTNLTPRPREKSLIEHTIKSIPDNQRLQKNEIKETSPLNFLDEEFESDLDKIINSKDFIERASKLIEVPDYKDNKEYIREYQLADKNSNQALEMLVYANKGLVNKNVSRYKALASVSFTEDDMFQHGMIGLLKAAEKFDLSRGFEFSTYATNWIKQSIIRGVMDNSNTIRIPVHMGELINKVRKKERESYSNFKEIDYEWIASELDQPLEKIIEAVRVQNTFMSKVSLDVPVGTDENSTLGELIEDTNSMEPSSYVIDESLQDIIFSLLSELKPRERDIIIKRYGLDGKDRRTLEAVGIDYGVTRERIRQIEAKALKRLQHPSRKEKLKDYYEVN